MRIQLGTVKGPEGPAGASINIKGAYDDLGALTQAHSEGQAGDAYLAGTSLYTWDGQWTPMPVAFDAVGAPKATLATADGEPSFSVEKQDDALAFTLSGTNKPFVGATADSPGKAGLLPAPPKGLVRAYIRSDGIWETRNNPGGEVQPEGASFGDMSWNQISELGRKAAAKPADYEDLIGAEKVFDTPGLGTLTAVVMDIAHFEKADNSGKAGFVLQTKEVLAGFPMHANVYDDKSANSYVNTDAYKKTLPTILRSFPEDLQKVICTVKIPYNAYIGSTTSQQFGDSYFSIRETTADLFPPSNREVWGISPMKEEGKLEPMYLTGDDGTQFAYWVKHPALLDHIKRRSDSTVPWGWWNRSSWYVASDGAGKTREQFMCVHPEGRTNQTSRATTGQGFAPCFCIG